MTFKWALSRSVFYQKTCWKGNKSKDLGRVARKGISTSLGLKLTFVLISHIRERSWALRFCGVLSSYDSKPNSNPNPERWKCNVRLRSYKTKFKIYTNPGIA